MARPKSEYEIENLLIQRLEAMGYQYVVLPSYTEVLDNLKHQLERFNAQKLIEAKGIPELSEDEFDRLMLRIENNTVYESAKILRDQHDLVLDNGNTVYLELFSADSSRNIYQVTNQVKMDKEHKDDVRYKNRYDVTILVNGLPLIQIELKRSGVEINEAVNQINRYRKFSFRGLFRFLQIFIVSNTDQTKYFANVNETNSKGEYIPILKSLVFFWTDEKNERINKLFDFATDFLDRFRITQMISRYMVVKQSEPVLMVMRPYQIYSVQASLKRVLDVNMHGYTFACTGSGKTLTSFKLATLLRDERRVDKVIFLIDRKDLDDQTVDEYNSFEKDCVDSTDSTRRLIAHLKDRDKKLIITTIQKMANAVKTPRYTNVMEPYRDKKVVFIIDECHRSQFGKMHREIIKHFRNINLIGYTGTPIFPEVAGPGGITTDEVFYSSPKVAPCIHKYTIKEAIADGNVLQFSVEYHRTIQMSGLPAGVDPAQADDPEYCKSAGINIKQYYREDERIELVAKHILENHERRMKPAGKDVYTSLFANESIPMLLRYYDALKANNDKDYRIAAIFTYGANEDLDGAGDEHSMEALERCMNDYNAIFGTSFSLDTFDGYRKDIAKRLKQKDLPQVDILLVVNMFLTGFDSKPLNTLYLDKDIANHSLLQAYSRTNRVDKTTKMFGKIVTYRNIKKMQDFVLKLYSQDGNPEEFLVRNYDAFVYQWEERVASVRLVAPTPEDAGHLKNEDLMRQFVLHFRALSQTLAILKTFSQFNWEDLNPFMDEEEFTSYKSWYLTIYELIKKSKEQPDGTESVLVDIDFEIELIRTDRINVVYIMNLLRDINRNDPEAKRKGIDLVLREVERSDNESVRVKRDVLKEFITERFFDLSPEIDIYEAYSDFEAEVMTREIRAFSDENKVSEDLIDRMLSSYSFAGHIEKESIRQELLPMRLGVLKTTKLMQTIHEFIVTIYKRFKAEGDDV